MVVNLTTGTPFKRILYLAIPMLVGNIFQLLYNFTDTIILGWFVGANAIAAIGASFPIIFLVISITIGLCMGSSIMVSQYFGAGKFKELKSVVSTITILMVFVTILTTVIGISITSPLLKILETPADIFEDSKTYTHIMFGGFIFIIYYNVYNGFLRGLGNSLSPLYFLIVSSVVNVALDLLFVGVFELGVAGAAYATVISEGIASALCVYYVYKRVPLLAVKLKDMRLQRELIRPMIRFSIPPAIQQGLASIGIVAIQGLVNSFGVSMTAAYFLASRIDSAVVMVALNFSAAISSFVAQNIGAGMVERVRDGYKHTLIFISITSSIMALLIYLNPDFILTMFIDYDPQVFKLATNYLSVVPFFYIAMSILFVTIGVLRGAGDTFFTMIISVVCMLIQLFLAYSMAYPIKMQQIFNDSHLPFLAWIANTLPDLGISAIWYSIPIAWSLAATMAVLRYLSNRWLKYSINK